MNVPLDDFVPEISRLAKNVPYPTQTDALLRAARQFCYETWYVKRLITLTTQQYVGLYALPMESGEEEIVTINAASGTQQPNGGTLPLWPTQVGNPNRAPQFPRWYSLVLPSSVNFFPIPDKEYPMQVQVVVQPTADAENLPIELFRGYARTIGYGAMSWIYAMPGESFTNVNEAQRMGRMFEAGINNGKTQAMRALLPGNPRVLPRRWVI